MRIGLAAEVTDQGGYLLEWIAHHRALGIRRFLVWDAGSDAVTTELVEALHTWGLLTRAPADAAGAPDWAAAAAGLDWLGVWSLEEFLVPSDGARLSSWLGGMPDGAGAVAVNRQTFGTAGAFRPDHLTRPGLTSRRFELRAADGFAGDLVAGALVRPTAVELRPGSALPGIPAGVDVVDAEGSVVATEPDGDRWRVPSVTGGWRLRRYLRSRWEFLELHGPDSVTELRALDRNEVRDPLPEPLVEARDRELERLKRMMQQSDVRTEARSWELEPRHALERLVHCRRTGRRMIEGWMIDHAGKACVLDLNYEVRTGNTGTGTDADIEDADETVQRPECYLVLPRPDVVERHPDAALLCGFRIYLPPLPEGETSTRIYTGDRLALDLAAEDFTETDELPDPR